MLSTLILSLSLLLILVNGHGWVNSPIPRGYIDNSEDSASTQPPCGSGTSGQYEEIPYTITAGDSMQVNFKTSDGHVGLACYFSLSYNDRGNFTQIGETIEDCVASSVYTETVTIPVDTVAGYAYLQWIWEAEDSTWYNCINLNVISPDFPMVEFEDGVSQLLSCSGDQVTTVDMPETSVVGQMTSMESQETTLPDEQETTVVIQETTTYVEEQETTFDEEQDTTVPPQETTADEVPQVSAVVLETTSFSGDNTATVEPTTDAKRKRQFDDTLSESYEEMYEYDPLESQYYRVKLTTTIERDRFVFIEINNLGDYPLVAAASAYGLITNLSLSEYTFHIEPQSSSSMSMCLPYLTVRDMFVTIFGACSGEYEIFVKSYPAEIDFNLKSELAIEVYEGSMMRIYSETTSTQQKSKRLILSGSGSNECSLSGPYMACGVPLEFIQEDSRCVDLPESFSQYDYGTGTGYYSITCYNDFSGTAQIERGKCIEWDEPIETDSSTLLATSLLMISSLFL